MPDQAISKNVDCRLWDCQLSKTLSTGVPKETRSLDELNMPYREVAKRRRLLQSTTSSKGGTLIG
jgi:hypothetical protein